MIKSRELVRLYRDSIGKYTYKQRDCIRSIYDILYAYGGRAAGVGSNHFARHKIVNLRPLTSRDQLYDGCAVLKTIHPGEPGYNLPPKYENDAVQIDYSHIGIGTDEGEILDSTTGGGRDGPGISTAPINSRSWDIIGDFTDVDYSDRTDGGAAAPPAPKQEVDKQVIKAIVIAASGSTVKLRAKASSSADTVWLENVPVGTTMGVIDKGSIWSKVRSQAGNTGWMKNEFLAFGAAPDLPAEPPPAAEPLPEGDSQPLDRAALLRELEEKLERVRTIIKALLT